MTKTATSLTALLLGLSMTTAAFAQETEEGGTEFGTDAEIGTEEGSIESEDPGLDTDPAADFTAWSGMTYDDLMMGMQTSPDNMAAMDALNNLSTGGEVFIVRVSDLQGESGENAAMLSEMMTTRQATLTDLQAAVDANATVRTALSDQNLLPANVVAVHPIEDGRLVVVVEDGPV
jgi:hypothetical protein